LVHTTTPNRECRRCRRAAWDWWRGSTGILDRALQPPPSRRCWHT